MNVIEIVAMLDSEILRLNQARTLLSGLESVPLARRGRPKGSTNRVSVTPASAPRAGRKSLSAEARERIAAAQRLRWTKQNAPTKKNPAKPAKVAPKKATAKKAPSSLPKVISAKKVAPKPASAKKTAAKPIPAKKQVPVKHPESKPVVVEATTE